MNFPNVSIEALPLAHQSTSSPATIENYKMNTDSSVFHKKSGITIGNPAFYFLTKQPTFLTPVVAQSSLFPKRL
jgi:hypothetical protein